MNLSLQSSRALTLVGYEISSTTDVFGEQGVKDPEIIKWRSQNDVIWIHADDRAGRDHRELLLISGIRTLRIRRKGGAMTAREQLRILSSVLPRLMRNYGERPKARHYSASAVNEVSRPSLRPEQI